MWNKRKSSHRPIIEALDSRRLLSVAPGTAAIEGGHIEVAGTKGADVITLSLNASDATKLDVTINGTTTTFNLADAPDGVEVRANKGDDTVTIDESHGVLGTNVEIHGDKGNDLLNGGSGDDLLDGGKGNDTINGGGGDDTIEGSSGNDDLNGDDGADHVDGGSGKDTVDGQAGDDDLEGGSGNDNLDGGVGDDTIDGGSGNDHEAGDVGDDRLIGGSGNDDCNGGDGDDSIEGGKGRDRVTGGTGADTFHSRDAEKELLDRGSDDDSDQLVDDKRVPESVRQAFQTQFPGATLRELKATNGTDGKPTAFKVEFRDADGSKREATFSPTGSKTATSTETTTLDGLPAPVQSAFTTAFPGVTLLKVETEVEDGGVTQYQIKFLNTSGVRQEARYNADGTVATDDHGGNSNGGGGDSGGSGGSGGTDDHGGSHGGSTDDEAGHT